jgi:hypothetical protein
MFHDDFQIVKQHNIPNYHGLIYIEKEIDFKWKI